MNMFESLVLPSINVVEVAGMNMTMTEIQRGGTGNGLVVSALFDESQNNESIAIKEWARKPWGMVYEWGNLYLCMGRGGTLAMGQTDGSRWTKGVIMNSLMIEQEGVESTGRIANGACTGYYLPNGQLTGMSLEVGIADGSRKGRVFLGLTVEEIDEGFRLHPEGSYITQVDKLGVGEDDESDEPTLEELEIPLSHTVVKPDGSIDVYGDNGPKITCGLINGKLEVVVGKFGEIKDFYYGQVSMPVRLFNMKTGRFRSEMKTDPESSKEKAAYFLRRTPQFCGTWKAY